MTDPQDAPHADVGLLVRWAGGSLLFLMLFVPTTYRPIKAALLAVLLFSLVLRAIRTRRLALSPDILLLSIGFATLGLVWITYGQSQGAPGAMTMATVYVAWPLVYTFLATGFDDDRMIDIVGAVLLLAALAVPAYSLSYVLWAAGLLPGVLYLPLDQGQAIGFYHGYVEFNLYSISSLLFLTPFLVAMIAIPPLRERWWTRPPLLWTALALNVLTVLLTGRRALLLVVGLTPAFVVAAISLLPSVRRLAIRRRAYAVLAFGAGAAVLGLAILTLSGQTSVTGLWTMFRSGWQFTTDPVAVSRNEQFHDLVQGWSASPVFGVGHGMPGPSVVRSFDMPWAYELSYVALLYHTGVIGVSAYAFGLLWLIAASYRIVRAGAATSDLLLPVLVGMAAFLVANATNPYLVKWDYLWTIFLPVALINLGQRERAEALSAAAV